MQGCIFSKTIKTFPELIFGRKKFFHSFNFGKVFLILRWKLFHKTSDFRNFFPEPKKAYFGKCSSLKI